MVCALAARKHVKAALKDYICRTSLTLKNKSIFPHSYGLVGDPLKKFG